MIDTDAMVLAPSYETFGEEAVLAQSGDLQIVLTAINLTAGFAVTLGGVELPTQRPAVMIRAAEFDEAGGDAGALKGSALTIAGKVWEVVSYERKPLAGGSGELLLILSDGDV